MDTELIEILKKPGKEWTPQERRIVQAGVNTHGRMALKEIRKDLRNDE